MQRLSPQLSVLLPFRDAADTLEAALDSVLSQAQVGLEVVAVDDGSRDAGPALAARLAASHRALRVIPAAGRGLVSALNTGLSACAAPLIARMDADDLCLPGRLRAQLDALTAAPSLSVLGCAVEPFPPGSYGGGTERYIAWQNGLLDPAAHRAQLFVESPLCHPSVVYRREAIEGVGGYRDGPFAEDYDLWLRCDAAGLSLAKLPEVLLRWRQGPDRATVTDPRYAPARFLELKAPFLARRLATRPGPVTIWGAGKAGRRLCAALSPLGVEVERFIDIDPRKIGRTAQGAPIVDPDDLRRRASPWVVVAVAAAGARDLVRARLDALGLREGADYLCAT